MKTKSIILSVIMLCYFVGLNAQSKKDTKETVTFNVHMHCDNCRNKIEKNITFEKGVKDFSADLEKQTVTVTYDNRKTDTQKLLAAFEKIGYPATLPAGCCKSGDKAACSKSDKGCPKAEGKTCSGQHAHSHN